MGLATRRSPSPNAEGLITLENLQRYMVDRVQSLSEKTQKVIINHSATST